MIHRVQVGAELKLFKVVEAGDIEGLRFGSAQGRQKESSQDCNDCNDHQQLDQSERPPPAVPEDPSRRLRSEIGHKPNGVHTLSTVE